MTDRSNFLCHPLPLTQAAENAQSVNHAHDGVGHRDPSSRGQTAAPSDNAPSNARRAYQPPELRALGNVRDLTFGSPIVGVNDFLGARQMVM